MVLQVEWMVLQVEWHYIVGCNVPLSLCAYIQAVRVRGKVRGAGDGGG